MEHEGNECVCGNKERAPVGMVADEVFCWLPTMSAIKQISRTSSYSQNTIDLLRLDGKASSIITARDRSSLQSLDWADDGKKLFVSSLTNDGSLLRQLDLKGNSNVLWESKGVVQPVSTPFLGGPAVPWAVPSPDGRHLAICVWNISANIWMIENF